MKTRILVSLFGVILASLISVLLVWLEPACLPFAPVLGVVGAVTGWISAGPDPKSVKHFPRR